MGATGSSDAVMISETELELKERLKSKVEIMQECLKNAHVTILSVRPDMKKRRSELLPTNKSLSAQLDKLKEELDQWQPAQKPLKEFTGKQNKLCVECMRHVQAVKVIKPVEDSPADENAPTITILEPELLVLGPSLDAVQPGSINDVRKVLHLETIGSRTPSLAPADQASSATSRSSSRESSTFSSTLHVDESGVKGEEAHPTPTTRSRSVSDASTSTVPPDGSRPLLIDTVNIPGYDFGQSLPSPVHLPDSTVNSPNSNYSTMVNLPGSTRGDQEISDAGSIPESLYSEPSVGRLEGRSGKLNVSSRHDPQASNEMNDSHSLHSQKVDFNDYDLDFTVPDFKITPNDKPTVPLTPFEVNRRLAETSPGSSGMMLLALPGSVLLYFVLKRLRGKTPDQEVIPMHNNESKTA